MINSYSDSCNCDWGGDSRGQQEWKWQLHWWQHCGSLVDTCSSFVSEDGSVVAVVVVLVFCLAMVAVVME